MKMKSVTARNDRLLQLKELAKVLAGSIDSCNDPKALPPLAKQYRETIREIEEIEGATNHGDEVSDILGERENEEHHERGVQRFRRQHDGGGQIGTEKSATDHLIEHVFERGGHECDAEKRFYGQSRLHGKDKAHKGVDRHDDGGKK